MKGDSNVPHYIFAANINFIGNLLKINLSLLYIKCLSLRGFEIKGEGTFTLFFF